jgi:NAD(P)-dependent dehydrogenase (short-subunit alcohol dehydrogenase family)
MGGRSRGEVPWRAGQRDLQRRPLPARHFDDISPADWSLLIAVNLTSHVRIIQAVLPALRESPMRRTMLRRRPPSSP